MEKFDVDNFKIGKIAEKIIKELFEEAGWKVIRYGYEHTVPELLPNFDKGKFLINGEAASFIRHQPDFIVVNQKNEAFFVEVKFRKDGIIKQEQIFNYPTCYIIFLTKDFILAQKLSNIWKYGDKNFETLNSFEPFKSISGKLIQKYVEKTRRKLGDETFLSQISEKIINKLTKKKLYKKRNMNCFVDDTNLQKDWERIEFLPSWIVEKRKKGISINCGRQWKGEHFFYKELILDDGKKRYYRKKYN